MAEAETTLHLQYGFGRASSKGPGQLLLAIPGELWRFVNQDNETKAYISDLTGHTKKAFIGEGKNSKEQGRKLYINDAKIGISLKGKELLEGIVLAIQGIQRVADREGKADPLIRPRLQAEPIGNTGRFMPEIELNLPDLPDDQLARVASEKMQAMAVKLRYGVPEVIGAKVVRAEGHVLLGVNPMGGCSMGTVPESPHVEASRVILREGNVYSREEQLIYLAGAVALAHAADLVQNR